MTHRYNAQKFASNEMCSLVLLFPMVSLQTPGPKPGVPQEDAFRLIVVNIVWKYTSLADTRLTHTGCFGESMNVSTPFGVICSRDRPQGGCMGHKCLVHQPIASEAVGTRTTPRLLPLFLYITCLPMSVPAILASSKSFPLAVLLEEEPKLTLIPLVE